MTDLTCAGGTDTPRRPITLAERLAIESEIERLIGVLDLADSDPDIEEDDDDTRLDYYAVLPRYGLDQSTGPTNFVEAYRAHRQAMGVRHDR